VAPNENQAQWSAVLALQQAAHRLVHILSFQLAHFGMTASEINAMANLAGRPGSTVSELAAAAGIRSTTMTSVLDRLEMRGLVRRGTVPGDRRAVRIEMTDPGRTAAGAIDAAIAAIERRALADLPAEARSGLQAALERFAEATA
jgi:MarR family transcriptional regulator, organic hydroperoxide resistance regulator